METQENKAHLIHDTLLIFLKKKEKTKEDAIAWLIQQGVSKERAPLIVEKLQNQILRRKKNDKLYLNIFGLISIAIGVTCVSLDISNICVAFFILGGKLLWEAMDIETTT